ncbi:hypothetical protein OHB00_25180 [Streptomyces sp. NBC_00631]|uniref:hypothetical protein n=1 Tax=Streptomyces sp. NBC_00631 TaxID=2975793 RepID=UPI0030DE0A81
MTARSGLRLLPWVGPEGKPCYLNTDDSEGFMSRLADHIESIQLGMASELLEQAASVLDDGTAKEEQLSLLAAQLAGALRDVLRVATSRGRCRAVGQNTNADFDL